MTKQERLTTIKEFIDWYWADNVLGNSLLDAAKNHVEEFHEKFPHEFHDFPDFTIPKIDNLKELLDQIGIELQEYTGFITLNNKVTNSVRLIKPISLNALIEEIAQLKYRQGIVHHHDRIYPMIKNACYDHLHDIDITP